MFRCRLIRGFALLLLTLCVVAWLGSYWRHATVCYAVKGVTRQLFIQSGYLIFTNEVIDVPQRSRWVWKLESADTKGTHESYVIIEHHIAGFAYWYQDMRWDGPAWCIWAPFWFPTFLSTLLLWFVWRKTHSKYNGKGFPIEPTAKAK